MDARAQASCPPCVGRSNETLTEAPSRSKSVKFAAEEFYR